MRPLLFTLCLGLLSCSSNIDSGTTADAGMPDLTAACIGRACMVPVCTGGGTTTITGRLFAGNGVDPVPGATVYVPLQDVVTQPTGASCDLCSRTPANVSTSTTTFDGSFKLSGVPAGS